MKSFKKIINIKKWSKHTKFKVFGAILVLLVLTFLATLKPEKQEMLNSSSPSMKRMVEADVKLDRKRVTVTYEDFYFISYASFSTSGAHAREEKFVGFMGNVYHADKGTAKIAGEMVDYTYQMLGVGENFLYGAKLTILLTVLTTLFGLILGIFLALGKISKKVFLKKICSGYIFFFRATPLLIQLLVIYYTIPGIFGFAWRDLFPKSNEAVFQGAFIASIIAFSLNSGAYCAEIVRAAIQSIDKGQYEAAKALGFSYRQTMSMIIIPQSIRRMLPSICNEFIMILKDVSLVFAISLMDITTISKNIMTNEGSYLVYIPALIIYLIITALFTWLFNKIENRFSVYE